MTDLAATRVIRLTLWADPTNTKLYVSRVVRMTLRTPDSRIDAIGLPSSAALGSPTLTPGTATISPTGLASSAALGSPDVIPIISPTGLASSAAVGTPDLIPVISPTGLGSSSAVGVPTLIPGAAPPGPAPPPLLPVNPPWNVDVTVLAQYANSPTLLLLIESMAGWIDPSANLQDFFDLIWNVDTAQGVGLDIWGRIVGVGRTLLVSTTDFLGFIGPDLQHSGPGFDQAPFFHGQAYTSNYALTDHAYRALILAKAAANICDGSIGAINALLVTLFGPDGLLPIAGNTYCTDGEDMTMTYTFTGALDPVSQAIVYQSGVLPKPTGVTLAVVAP